MKKHNWINRKLDQIFYKKYNWEIVKSRSLMANEYLTMDFIKQGYKVYKTMHSYRFKYRIILFKLK